MKNFKRRFLWTLLLLAVGLSLWGVVEHHRRKWRLEAYKAELVKQGVEFDLVKLIPSMPPDKDNAAMRLRRLTVQLQPQPLKDLDVILPMKMLSLGRARMEWKQPRPHGMERVISWDQVVGVLVSNQVVLDEIRTSLDRPFMDFKLDYQQGFSLSLPLHSELRNVSHWLGVRALAELRADNSEGAVEDIKGVLQLTRLWRQEPLLHSQRSANTIDNQAFRLTWELLQAANLERADLAGLQSSWMMTNQPAQWAKAIILEGCFVVRSLKEMRRSSNVYESEFESIGVYQMGKLPDFPSSGGKLGEWFRYGWEVIEQSGKIVLEKVRMKHWQYLKSYDDEEIYLRQIANLLNTLDKLARGESVVEALQIFQLRFTEVTAASQTDGTEYSHAQFEIYEKLPVSAYRNKTLQRMARVAIALKRYQLNHGEWPETLETLVPEYLAVVPIDPADGKPLRYTRKPNNEFLLYALGENLVDDGGDPAHDKSDQYPNFLRGKDWVWPMPVNEVANN